MSTKLGALSIGSTVKLNVNGTAKDFLVIHQGLPSSLYDSSCNGTWLLMKELYEKRVWDSSDNDYENSDIHSYLNNTFLNLFDNNIVSVIKEVKIPYRKGKGLDGTTVSGSSGLKTKVFLLGGYEVGWTKNDYNSFPVDGACLSFFSEKTDAVRKATISGTGMSWWLRSASTYYNTYVWAVSDKGDFYKFRDHAEDMATRPAIIMPQTLLVSDDGYLCTNLAPAAPQDIEIPSSVMGGSSIAISWGISVDEDDNLEGYVVERSVDGGTSWRQIYQGPERNTINTVPFGTETVMYRVKAYDSEGEFSSYRTSSQVAVVNNTAPSAPPAITTPTDIKGGASLVIAWGAASDSENNIVSYELQRQVDDGAWSTIINANVLNYTDSITKGWSSVAYRVRACDPYTTSGWTTSPTRAVDNNIAPIFTCNNVNGSNLGTKSSGFSVLYKVSDADGDTITVVERMDGVTKRTYTATDGASNSFAVTGEYFQKLLNGSHTMVITATDSKSTTTYTLYFTKSVTTAVITLEEPMEADDTISVCAITIAGSIPSDAEYKVEVTNNANDSSPIWEDCTNESKSRRNYLFKNNTASDGFAFNFKVTAKRGASGDSGYITSIQGGFQ